MELDLTTGQGRPAQGGVCTPADEANTACSDLSIEVTVRGAPSRPNDVVDIDGWSVPLTGRAHDCASNGKLLVVATASQVVLVDVARHKSNELVKGGADRVAIGAGWVAWATSSELQAETVDTFVDANANPRGDASDGAASEVRITSADKRYVANLRACCKMFAKLGQAKPNEEGVGLIGLSSVCDDMATSLERGGAPRLNYSDWEKMRTILDGSRVPVSCRAVLLKVQKK